jgi:hypothetical protein
MKSKTRSGSLDSLPKAQPPSLPFVFVDRSLGRLRFPQLLRAAGVTLITLAEHYGIPADEDVKDVTWIRDSAEQGWVSFMKDDAVRRVPAERAAVRDHQARCFALARADISAPDGAALFLQHLDQIAEACVQPGPFFYVVTKGAGLQRRPLDD